MKSCPSLYLGYCVVVLVDIPDFVVPIRISLIRGLLLTWKLLNQGFLVFELKSSLRKFYGRHHDLLNHYGISVS